jgi:hypothetical protein
VVSIKPIEQVASKWARVTPGRSADYEAGISAPRRSWAASAAAAEAAYQAGVQAAIQRKAFSGGVRRAGDEKWQRKAREVGVGRYGPGVQAAQSDYAQGFAPFASTIASLSIPDRKAKGDPANIDRVRILAAALHEKKLAQQAGGGG